MYLTLIDERIEEIKENFNNKPFFVFLSLTNTCNANCVFCDVRQNKKLLCDVDVYRLIDELADMGTKYLHFTGGGEPFTDNKIVDYMKYASNKSINIVFISNGYLLDEEKIKLLKDVNLKIVFLSIDSFSPCIHNELRRTQNLFEKAVCSINLLKKHIPNVKININHVLNRNNIDDFEKFLNLKNSYNFDCINPIVIKDCPMLFPTQEQIKSFNNNKSRYLDILKEKNIKLLSGSLDLFEEEVDRRGNRHQNDDMRCVFGNYSCFIDCPTGLGYPCDCSVHRDRALYCLGDLHNQSFSDIWHGSKRQELMHKLNCGKLECKKKCDEANCVFNKRYFEEGKNE